VIFVGSWIDDVEVDNIINNNVLIEQDNFIADDLLVACSFTVFLFHIDTCIVGDSGESNFASQNCLTYVHNTIINYFISIIGM